MFYPPPTKRNIFPYLETDFYIVTESQIEKPPFLPIFFFENLVVSIKFKYLRNEPETEKNVTTKSEVALKR